VRVFWTAAAQQDRVDIYSGPRNLDMGLS